MDEQKKFLLIEKLRKAKELAQQRREKEKELKKKKASARLEKKRNDREVSNEATKEKIEKVTKEETEEVTINTETLKSTDPKVSLKQCSNQKFSIKIKPSKSIISIKVNKKPMKKSTERSRKYRSKLSDEEKEVIRQKDRERKRKLREAKIIKPIADMNEREKRIQRKKWKLSKRESRKKQRSLESVVFQTPPNSDDEAHAINFSNRGCASRKKKKLTRTKMYRELQEAKNIIKKLKAQKEKYKKRWQRSRVPKKNATSPSPITKVTTLINKRVVPADIRRQLLIGETIKSQILENLKQDGNSYKKKQCYKKVLSGPLYKKYRLQNELRPLISCKQNRKWQATGKNVTLYQRKSGKPVLSKLGREKIRIFFERDDISRMCPGKKEFKRKGPIRKQKRLLTLSLKECYKKFIQSSTDKMSYVSFIKAKPFWVVSPTNSDREICLCVKHENFSLNCNKLRILKMKDDTRISEILKEEKVELRITETTNKTSYHQWQSRIDERIINDTKKKIRITSKILVEATVKDLAVTFFQQLPLMKQHVRNITHQFNEMKHLKENLAPNEVILQVDFSENYYCKMHTEIQSMHFGASKRQLSLHTGVMYFNQNGSLTTKSFCTVSQNLDRQCHGVWGHLTSILKDFVKHHPDVDTVHFFSDGPTSQYKNRYNICLLITVLPKIFKNLKYTTWNYSEAGHGKGPMDGVGGSLKRQADNFVLRGGDIMTASDFVTLFIDSKTKVSLVESDEIEQIKNYPVLQRGVPKIPNITKLYQIAWLNNSTYLYTREISCFNCQQICDHFSSGTGKVKFNNFGDAEEPEVPEQPNSDANVGDWVAVVYGEKWFPGLVQISDNGQLTVKFMDRFGNNAFYWPKVDDIQQVAFKDILCKLNFAPQQLSSTRPNIYHVINSIDLDDLL